MADHEVTIIGAGFSGIGAAIRLTQAGIDDFVILDERDDIGGVWYVNTYPGVAVDITSFTYSFAFEPNPGWSRVFAPGAELKAYADHCVEKYGLRRHLRLNTRVVSTAFEEDDDEWRVLLADGSTVSSRYVISAVGGLTKPKAPDIEGLADFRGKVMHTAEWDHAYSLRGRRVGIIGTGASALQAIPVIARELEQLYVYQRTPIWVFPKPDFRIPQGLQRVFRAAPLTQKAIRGVTDVLTELGFVLAVVNYKQLPFLVKSGERASQRHLRRQVEDPVTREKLTPKYGLGCKRPSVSNTYLRTFNRANVELVTEGIERITPTGIRTSYGREQEFDTLILATGFSVLENVPPFPVVGEGGREIGEFWRTERFQAYEGTSVKGFPNLWFVLGPYAFTGGSWFGMIEYQVTHAMRVINESRRRGTTRAGVTATAHDRSFRRVQQRQKSTVFLNNNCGPANSYYFDEHGDAPFVRPSSTYEASWRARHFSLDDYSFSGTAGAASVLDRDPH
ncbi:MAG: NAD(P)/FAD-dependent oxidoreductase [Streptosporangiaceae bacterium]